MSFSSEIKVNYNLRLNSAKFTKKHLNLFIRQSDSYKLEEKIKFTLLLCHMMAAGAKLLALFVPLLTTFWLSNRMKLSQRHGILREELLAAAERLLKKLFISNLLLVSFDAFEKFKI